MAFNFCGVQIFVDFVGSSYPQKITKLTYTVNRLCHENINSQNLLSFLIHENLNPQK